MSRSRSFAWVVVAYLVALLVGYFCISAVYPQQPILAALVADVAGTTVVFAFSLAFRNASFYDPYWSVIPILLLFYWWCFFAFPGHMRVWLAAALVIAWGLRLTWNWASGWEGIGHEDWRYANLAEQTGAFYWLVNYFGIHLLPTLWVFLGCLPLVLVVSKPSSLNGWDAAAVAIGIAALWLETVADLELRKFRQIRKSRAEVLDTGVWRWCRHPNYLGEMGVWLALACFGAAVSATTWWIWIGFAWMVILFVGISIPMIEKKLVADKPGYADYQRVVPQLLPRIPETGNKV